MSASIGLVVDQAHAADVVVQSSTTAFGATTAGGNCSTSIANATAPRAIADAQGDDFLATTGRDQLVTALFPDPDEGSIGLAPYTLALPSTGVTVDIAYHNMSAADTLSSENSSWGAPATAAPPDLQFQAAEQMQDCSVKPTRLVSTAQGGTSASPTLFWNASGFGSAAERNSRDSVLFTFSRSVDNFGAWFGDLETRVEDSTSGVDGGVQAYIKLYDVAGNVLAVDPVVPNDQRAVTADTIPPGNPGFDDDGFGCGDQDSNDDFSSCGNHGTRFLGFSWDTPTVAAFQVIVGDHDHCVEVPSDCDANSEHLSFIGPSMAVDNPTITIDKTVTNDNWGTAEPADFSFEVTRNPGVDDDSFVTSAGTPNDLVLGDSYAVSEVATADYTQVSAECFTDFPDLDGMADTPVDIANFVAFGDAVYECEFANADDPVPLPLTLTKVVVNDQGGTAGPGDFDLVATVGGVANTLSSGDSIDLTSPAEVSVSKVLTDGYVQTGLSCTDAADNELGDTVTPSLAMGAIDCTITNDDIAPTLAVLKLVINDDVGDRDPSDFALFITQDGVTRVFRSGDSVPIAANSPVEMSEGEAEGYELVDIVCTDSTGSDVGNPFTPVAGVAYTCTYTNDDDPVDVSPTTPTTLPPVTVPAPTTTVAPPTTTPTTVSRDLPATGSDSTNRLLPIGALFVGLGGAVVVVTRRS